MYKKKKIQEKLEPLCAAGGEWKMVQTLWWFLEKLNIELPYAPAIPFPVYTKRIESRV